MSVFGAAWIVARPFACLPPPPPRRPPNSLRSDRHIVGTARTKFHDDPDNLAKDCGLANLPFREFAANEVWVELAMIAQELLAYTQTLLLTGELARCEPKRLRYRLLHTAGRLAFHARTARLRLPASWPWARELAAAFAALAALPAR